MDYIKKAAFSGNNFNTGRNPQFPGQGNLMKSAGKLAFVVNGMDVSYTRKF